MTDNEHRVFGYIRSYPGLSKPRIAKAINGLDQLQVIEIIESLESKGLLNNAKTEWNGKYSCRHWRNIAFDEWISNALRFMCHEVSVNGKQDFNPGDLLPVFNNELNESNIREIFELLASRGFARTDFRSKDDPQSIRLIDTACSAYERGEFAGKQGQEISIMVDNSIAQNIIASTVYGGVNQSSDSSDNRSINEGTTNKKNILKTASVIIGIMASIATVVLFMNWLLSRCSG